MKIKTFFLFICLIPFLYQCNLPDNQNVSSEKQSSLSIVDINQWRGNNRNGIYDESNLLKVWPENGPELLWSTDSLSMGNSSMSFGNKTIYLTGTIGKMDEVIAIDLQGNIKWRMPYGRAWNESYPEARCTPTIDNEKLYVSSGLGDVACLDAISGDILWKVNANDKYEGKLNLWGIAESLLIVDDKVIFSPAGNQTTIIALDKLTGEEIWASKSIQDSTAYVSPILINYAEKKIIVNVTSNHVVGVNAQDGDILWKYRYFDLYPNPSHPHAPIINCVTPLYNDGKIYVTSGYNAAGAMFKILPDASNIELLWTDTIIDTHHGGVVQVGDYIYGSNWINNSQGNWCCINWTSGEKQYEAKWKTKGPIIYADGMLYCYEEKTGYLALVEANPNEYKIVSSFKIPLGNGPHWSHPVINNGVLFVRHGKALMAYSITKN
ncbi:MAG: PQQ-like beta-propeller repeat protein [Bacteroidales bacterium]|nr:PQQ-like beta-propeller repeat protein [Bacteroidales bacterium]